MLHLFWLVSLCCLYISNTSVPISVIDSDDDVGVAAFVVLDATAKEQRETTKEAHHVSFQA